jgi:ACS family pantothenate transporter-like MFS transporter
MWAMIGTSIALAIWTSGLLYLTSKSEKKRLVEAQSGDGDEKNLEVGIVGNFDAKA